MARLLKYVRETGRIVGVWQTTDLALLLLQCQADDPVHGYVLRDLGEEEDRLSPEDLSTRYLVRDDCLIERPPATAEGA